MGEGAGAIKLFWYQRPQGNFGDDLNPWLWPKLLPGLIDNDGPWFVGIGTLLNERLPAQGELVVLGAGAGLGQVPRPDARWHIHGVRGPLSAEALGIAPSLALGDPATLVSRFVPAAAERRGVGFMPHYASLEHWDWRATAATLGLVFVDPEAPVEVTLAQIAGLSGLITEAMHGAVVADALRTPWTAVAIDPDFYARKWRDWGASVGLEPTIHRLPALSEYRSSPRDWAKRALIKAGAGKNITPPPPRLSPPATVAEAILRLETLAAGPRQLSRSADHAHTTTRLQDAVQRLRSTL